MTEQNEQNLAQLQSQLAGIQAQAQAQEESVSTGAAPEPIVVAQAPESAAPTTNASAIVEGLLARLSQLESTQAQLAAASHGAVAVPSLPGSPSEEKESVAKQSGAIGYYQVTTTDGVQIRAYLYPDGTSRLQ